MARSDVRVGILPFFVACAAGITAQFATPVVWAEDKPDSAVRSFVEQVNGASRSFFSSGSDKDAREKCRQLLSWAFDVPAMGEFVLGKAWARASEEDRKEFLAAFEDEIISEYLHRMKGGTAMTFVGTRSPVHGDLLAASRVAVTGKNDQIWIWRMRPQGSTWRIVDVSVDGRSAILSERKTYADVLQANHGDMKELIAFIRSRADP
jgi:phospholipid transport system substrate-binding protein